MCRMNIVREAFHRWLRRDITTAELDAAVRRELSGDHPRDSEILEQFRWFVTGSQAFHERGRCAPTSPQCSEESAEPLSVQ